MAAAIRTNTILRITGGPQFRESCGVEHGDGGAGGWSPHPHSPGDLTALRLVYFLIEIAGVTKLAFTQVLYAFGIPMTFLLATVTAGEKYNGTSMA